MKYRGLQIYYLLVKRCQSTFSKPVITVPLKWTKKVSRNLAEKQQQELIAKSKQGNTKVCIVSCKNKNLNHYLGQSYGKFDSVPLASKGWEHRQSNGDYFIINAHGRNPSVAVDQTTFSDLCLEDKIVHAINEMGYVVPTEIQKLSITSILTGKNCLIAAETGSGKTLSYLAPLFQNLLNHKVVFPKHSLNSPLALIITPGRELAEQIGSICDNFAEHVPLKPLTLVGGHLKKRMLDVDVKEVDILIASFGAISKLTTTKIYELSQVRHVVLEEADTLLDDSFNEKLRHFLQRIQLQTTAVPIEGSAAAQVILASATMPRSTKDILEGIIPFDSLIKITTSHLHRLLPHVPQKFLRISHLDKAAKLLEIVKKDTFRNLPVVVFSNTSEKSDWISIFLNENGISCANLNGSMGQRFRENRFKEYLSGKYQVLSCTDIVSRGLDTINTNHVINYDAPMNISDYIHRCGRVGRVGSQASGGHVTTFVCNRSEVELVQKLEFAARKTENELHNVNANVKRLLRRRETKNPHRLLSSLP